MTIASSRYIAHAETCWSRSSAAVMVRLELLFKEAIKNPEIFFQGFGALEYIRYVRRERAAVVISLGN
jgi:hypothetical protein